MLNIDEIFAEPELKATTLIALFKVATGETTNALAARYEAPRPTVEAEVVEPRNAVMSNLERSTTVAAPCESVRVENSKKGIGIIPCRSPPAETEKTPHAHTHARDWEPTPFADWILRPDVDGRMGWESPDLPEAVRWWARIRI